MAVAATSSTHGAARYHWWFSIAVTAAVLCLTLVDSACMQGLALSREAIAQQQWWRIVSSQLVHLSSNHAVLNIAGYWTVCTLFRNELTVWKESVLLTLSALGVGSGIYCLSPDIDWYYGLSGAIHGLLTGSAVISLGHARFIPSVCILAVALKIGHEQWVEPADSVTARIIGGDIAVDSHLYGAITGLVAGALLLAFDRLSQHRHRPPQSA